MDVLKSGPTGLPNDFDSFVNLFRIMLNQMVNISGSTNPNYSFNVLGVSATPRITTYIEVILPIVIGFLGVLIAIRVVLKLFRRFSR